MNRLPSEAHRTLYNVADALLPPPPGAVGVDWAPGVEAFLARRGDAAARRLERLLAKLEARPPWGWRARAFSRLSRTERAARLASGDGADRAWLCELLAEAAPRPQSSSGA